MQYKLSSFLFLNHRLTPGLPNVKYYCMPQNWSQLISIATRFSFWFIEIVHLQSYIVVDSSAGFFFELLLMDRLNTIDILQRSVFWEDHRCGLCNKLKSERRGRSVFHCLFCMDILEISFSNFTATDSVHSNIENMLTAPFHM